MTLTLRGGLGPPVWPWSLQLSIGGYSYPRPQEGAEAPWDVFDAFFVAAGFGGSFRPRYGEHSRGGRVLSSLEPTPEASPRLRPGNNLRDRGKPARSLNEAHVLYEVKGVFRPSGIELGFPPSEPRERVVTSVAEAHDVPDRWICAVSGGMGAYGRTRQALVESEFGPWEVEFLSTRYGLWNFEEAVAETTFFEMDLFTLRSEKGDVEVWLRYDSEDGHLSDSQEGLRMHLSWSWSCGASGVDEMFEDVVAPLVGGPDRLDPDSW